MSRNYQLGFPLNNIFHLFFLNIARLKKKISILRKNFLCYLDNFNQIQKKNLLICFCKNR